jgi:hypothetical protein
VVGIELVVAVRRNEQRGHPLDPANEQPNDVERCLIGPMEILDDEHAWQLSELLGQRLVQLVRSHLTPNELGERAACLVRDLSQRRERARREERIACPLENSHASSNAVDERSDQRALANTRLASDEHSASAPGCSDCEGFVQRRERLLALEEHLPRGCRRLDRGHVSMVSR